mmetsp:Transcript_68498/g.164500  ORF Transcript_68498/g.164500 Transcript_68498/m.164500 type:complete len:367 (+) Transcript_68498:130-1230(+)
MPPRVIICDLCGGKFFPHSIEKHQKVCRQKVGVQLHPCPYCGMGVPMLEMDAHVLKCPEAKAAGAQPTGASAALERRLKNNKARQEKGLPAGQAEDNRALGGGNGEMPSEYADGDDVRVECKICGRKFAFDRIGKHQQICTKLANKKPRKPFEAKRTYNEGGSDGAVIGISSVPTGKGGRGRAPVGCATDLAHKPDPKPVKTHWREASKAFREACKAGREYPMPGQGGGGRSYGSSAPTKGRTAAGRGGGGGASRPPQNAGFNGRSTPSQGKTQRSPSPGAQPPRQKQQASPPPPANGRPPAGSGFAAARHSRGPPLPEWGSAGARSYGRDCMTGPIGGGGGGGNPFSSNETSMGNPLASRRGSPF